MRYSRDEKEFLEKLGSQIRKKRLEKNWAQEKLASECGLHRTYIGAIERGERNISILNLLKISKILNINLSSLLDFKK